MSTIVVWVLVLWTGNGPVVIDNIASEANCKAEIAIYNGSSGGYGRGSCIMVRKAVPK